MDPIDDFKARLGLGATPGAPAPQVTSPLEDFRARLATLGVAAPTAPTPPSPSAVAGGVAAARDDLRTNRPALVDYATRALAIGANGLPVVGPYAGAAANALRDHMAPDARNPALASAGAVATKEAPGDPAITVGGPVRPGAVTVPATQSPLYPSLAPKGAGGAGGAYGDPYAKLRGALEADQARVLGTYDTEKDQTMGLGSLVQEREAAVGQARQVLAAKQVRDAELAALEAEDARKRFDDYTARTDALNAQLAERKVDPSRLLSSLDVGSKAGMLIGGIAGGILSALNGGRNGVVDQLTKMIDDDVRMQYDDIARSRDSVRERNTLLGQYMQVHGNAELAKLQARSATYAATKDAILGRAEELGSREAMQNAMLAAGQIDRKQAELVQAIDANKLMVAQQQAAAAAAAARASEEKLWQRQMDLAKLGLEKDKVTIEAAKLRTGDDDKVNAEVQHLADKLATPELAQAAVAVENSKRRIMGADGKVDPTKGLPGVGPTADLRERVAPPLSQMSARDMLLRGPVAGALANKAVGLDDSERVARQDFEQLKLAYRKMITGSGGSEQEMNAIMQAFEGAKTPAEITNAVTKADEMVARVRTQQMAGASPRAQAVFKARLEGIAPSMPNTVKVK